MLSQRRKTRAFNERTRTGERPCCESMPSDLRCYLYPYFVRSHAQRLRRRRRQGGRLRFDASVSSTGISARHDCDSLQPIRGPLHDPRTSCKINFSTWQRLNYSITQNRLRTSLKHSFNLDTTEVAPLAEANAINHLPTAVSTPVAGNELATA